MALAFSPLFNLADTYFMIAGDAGVNPLCGTTGGVAFARYSVQVAMQYEIDPRDLASKWPSGYFSQGSFGPNQYPQYIYGTEVFELNKDLQDRAIHLASKANLSDNSASQTYRAKYPHTDAAAKGPSVFAGDVASSDNWFSGPTLAEAFTNYTALVTNGTGKYCMAAQEDSGSLEALLRADIAGRVDFSRVILMRTASDFDRPPPGITTEDNLLYDDLDAYPLALDNMYKAGIEIWKDIKASWTSTYQKGIKPSNYIGDILDSLKGPVKPDFG
jgi:purine nucleoside permease